MPRRIRSLVRRLLTRPERGAVILAYHRIADVQLDPSGLAVAPDRLAEQMAALVRIAEPVRLGELAAGRRRVRSGRPTVAVTFDDGYADNLHMARPILSRFGIPATVFIPSDAIGRSRAFWWDELEALVFNSSQLPSRLDIVIAGRRVTADVADDGGASDRSGRHRDWIVWNGPARTPRQRLYTLLWQQLQRLPAAEHESALNGLAAWTGSDRQQPPQHPTLDAGGVRSLIEGGLIEVGGHTVTHAPLPHLPADRQQYEIEANRRDLEAVSGTRPAAFSYPYGMVSDQTVEFVREAGFKAAVTTEAAAVTERTDPHLLPRLGVENWDADTFTAEVSRLLTNH